MVPKPASTISLYRISQPADPATAPNATPPSFDPAFTDEDALIILRSSDNIQYRMHAVVLRTASGFFRNMLALPGPVSPEAATQQSDSIALDETSEVLGKLFRMISGLKCGDLNSFDVFQGILKAAHKYDMEGVVETLRRLITLVDLQDQPLKIYALAAQYGWEQEAIAASKRTLALPIHQEKYDAVLETIPSAYLLRLLKLHRKRKICFEKNVIMPGAKRTKFFKLKECSCEEEGDRRFSNAEGMWKLAYAMFESMDRRVDGEELLEGRWKSCLQGNEKFCARCNMSTKDIESRVNGFITSLPSTI